MDGGDCGELRSIRRAKGPRQPESERSVFRLATPRRAARHLRAQKGLEMDATPQPPSQPSPLFVTVKSPDMTCANLNAHPSFDPRGGPAAIEGPGGALQPVSSDKAKPVMMLLISDCMPQRAETNFCTSTTTGRKRG